MQFWVIVLFAVVLLADSLGAAVQPDGWGLGPGAVAAVALAPMVLIALSVHAIIAAAWHRLDRHGSIRMAVLADRVLLSGRMATLGVHGFNVLVLGWVQAVRGVTGDLILVDELLAVAPAAAVIVAGWWSYYPIERSLREAVLMRRLDDGMTVYPTPSRRAYVWSNVRHGLLLTAVPMVLVVTWMETFEAVLGRIGGWATATEAAGSIAAAAQWVVAPGTREWVMVGGHLAGVSLVFLLGPLVMRMVWDTTPLSAGPLRERLQAMCGETNVGVRDLLVWRTHGSMVNGAVMGLLARVRYVLLTDALLDSLPPDQVEAVMAHELAHVRRRHIPWLACVMFAGFSGVTIAGNLLVAWTPWPTAGAAATFAEIALGVGSLLMVMVIFGYASRRFEWQADAFAARYLSGDSPTVTTPAVSAMAGALGSVAKLNYIPRKKWTWRHGSIAQRQHKLETLIGRPVDAMPIDRAVRRIKQAAVAVLVVSVAVGFVMAR